MQLCNHISGRVKPRNQHAIVMSQLYKCADAHGNIIKLFADGDKFSLAVCPAGTNISRIITVCHCIRDAYREYNAALREGVRVA